MKIYLYIFISILLTLLLLFFAIKIALLILKTKNIKELNKVDNKLREYFKDFSKDKLAIIDETPVKVLLGSNWYWITPLKYRQYTRLCIMFARVLEKLEGLNIDINDANKQIGDIVENSEHELFRMLACILFFTKYEYEERQEKINEGIQREYKNIVNNATIDQIARALEVIAMQNDITRAFKIFGILQVKKKAAMS